MSAVRNYALVTGAYWGFTLTDGALRMLVLLHFDRLGYGAMQIALLFVLYELCGVVTNLLGGWIAARSGLKVTLLGGLLLQIAALLMLALLKPGWSAVVSVAYVMASQALSGIAKDLTKMSAKTAIKAVVPDGADGALFKWVARLTGSKNALKGAGFFLGGLLLGWLGFVGALTAMAAGLAVVLAGTVLALPPALGKAKSKAKFTQLLSKDPAINWLSAARFFLFGARDVWFVVGLPVFLVGVLGWADAAVGGFLAAWVIGYGLIQAIVPEILRQSSGAGVDGGSATRWAAALVLVPLGLLAALRLGLDPELSVIAGLALFGLVFAINSAVHSYLVLAYSDGDKVALNVGFYYMANAGGRLAGTLLSGLSYQVGGITACLAVSAALVAAAAGLSVKLPRGQGVPITAKLNEAES